MRLILVDQIAKVNYKYTLSLARALKDKGIKVTLMLDQFEDKDLDIDSKRLFKTDEKNISKISKLINYIYSYEKILGYVKKYGIDIVHLQWFACAPIDLVFIKILKNNGVKVIVTAHDLLPFKKKNMNKIVFRKIYNNSDRIIVQAKANIERFEKEFPKNIGKICMIPHGHFLDYALVQNKSIARRKKNISQNDFVFLFFGQIKKVKGVHILLEAFSKIKDDYENAKLIIAGNVWADDFSSYEYFINKNNMKDKVLTDIRFIPEEDVADYYSLCDICVQPYLDVYQSGVVQLTYAYKKPAIVSDLEPFKEVVIDDVTGFIFKSGDSDDLADTMIKSIQCLDKLSIMGEKGYDYIKQKYSWDCIADEIVSKCYNLNGENLV